MRYKYIVVAVIDTGVDDNNGYIDDVYGIELKW